MHAIEICHWHHLPESETCFKVIGSVILVQIGQVIVSDMELDSFTVGTCVYRRVICNEKQADLHPVCGSDSTKPLFKLVPIIFTYLHALYHSCWVGSWVKDIWVRVWPSSNSVKLPQISDDKPMTADNTRVVRRKKWHVEIVASTSHNTRLQWSIDTDNIDNYK